jgi:hypothetical protein
MNASAIAIAARPAAQGYASREYALALAEFGAVHELPSCGGALLVRPIPGAAAHDAMGCYPLFSCQDWTPLADDLEPLADRLVCVSLVTDPLADVTLAQLHAAFADVCYGYKEHFVTDLRQSLEQSVQSHHQRNIRKALAWMEVLQMPASSALLTEWQSLYDNLIRRHEISGIARFSPLSFERQMSVPGFTAFAAIDGEEILGMTLWYVRGEAAYYHLGAYSDRGYQRAASFAIFSAALSYFQSAGVRWAALGAGAGAKAAESGLTRFKQGWATGTRTAYFCGRILQPAVYKSLADDAAAATDYFPAYRRPAP